MGIGRGFQVNHPASEGISCLPPSPQRCTITHVYGRRNTHGSLSTRFSPRHLPGAPQATPGPSNSARRRPSRLTGASFVTTGRCGAVPEVSGGGEYWGKRERYGKKGLEWGSERPPNLGDQGPPRALQSHSRQPLKVSNQGGSPVVTPRQPRSPCTVSGGAECGWARLRPASAERTPPGAQRLM